MTTKRVLYYPQYTHWWLQQNPSTQCTTNYRQRLYPRAVERVILSRKVTYCLVPELLTMLKWLGFWGISHPFTGQLKTYSYFITSSSSVALSLSTFGRTPRWKTYLRQYEMRKLPATRGERRVYHCKDSCGCLLNEQGNDCQWMLQFFLARGALKFVAMDILGSLLMVLNGHQSVMVMMDRYSKLMRAICTSNTTASHIASLVMYTCIIYIVIQRMGRWTLERSSSKMLPSAMRLFR